MTSLEDPNARLKAAIRATMRPYWSGEMNYNGLTRGVRVWFNGDRIMIRCFACGANEDITDLVAELKKYGRHNCPSELYQPWKILILGTDEYYDVESRQEHFEHKVIAHAAGLLQRKEADNA